MRGMSTAKPYVLIVCRFDLSEPIFRCQGFYCCTDEMIDVQRHGGGHAEV